MQASTSRTDTESIPKVSIVIPVFNIAEHVQYSLRSAIEQTYRNTEIIVVDDGSTDDSFCVCEEMLSSQDNAKLYKKENGGLSSARNYGVERASGDYVFFLDGDDSIDFRAIEYLVSLALENDVNVVTSQLGKTSSSGRFDGSIVDEGEVLSATDLLRKMLLLDGETGSACGKLIATDLVRSIRFPEGQLFEDFGVIARIIYETESICWTGSVLYGYATRAGSITGVQNYDLRHLRGMNLSLETVKRVLEKTSLKNSKESVCYATFCSLRVAPKLSKTIIRANGEAREYVARTKQGCREVAAMSGVSLKWRLRCALFAFSSSLYRLSYKLYGVASGRVVG